MNKKIILSSLPAMLRIAMQAGVLTALLLLPVIALAQPGTLTVSLPVLISNLVATALQVLWIIAIGFVVIMFVIAGFKYLTAQGESSKIDEANKAIIWGTVGTAVIVLAWSIISLVRIQIGV